jgi:glycosyltransferase involved in cell wall biosynthesis
MRILLYNFVQPEEPGAGGVGVYLGNLARSLAAEHEVIILSAGDRYSPTRREPRIDYSRDDYDRAVIVNAPAPAPAAYTFGDPGIYTDSSALDFVPAALRERYGAIDVFHFQNVEGLTRSFFHRLRAEFPRARLIYSAHNYHPLCPRVSLWFQDRAVCVDYRGGVACTDCRMPVFDPKYIRNRRRLIWAEKAHPRLAAIAAPLTALAKRARRTLVAWRTRRLPALPVVVGAPSAPPAPSSLPPAPAAAYRAFREANIALARDVFDQVLAVSKRTRQVIVDRGMPADKVAVSYIGTAHKGAYLASTKIGDIGDGLHIGLIGYMGGDKGFPFLLDCLEAMPAPLAAGLRVTVAARNTDPVAHARLLALASRFRDLRYFDGYTHANLDQVLAGVNLGLIPVLWEDNLPQTAIELVSRGIPILTSDRGGAQEIAESPAFVFRAGEVDDFIDHVSRIADRTLPLFAFWRTPMRIVSMDEHLADLMTYYAPVPVPANRLTPDDSTG